MAPTDVESIEETEHYTARINVSIPLKAGNVVRANVYIPKLKGPFPVLATYGPYGKDIKYADFFPKVYVDLPEEQRGPHCAWEVPNPSYWCQKGYAIVRADERGCGQSPGLLDTMSKGTSECFFDVIEWAAEQDWSSGKVGLLGISYFAGSQWRVAARRPKGLTCIIPWEGMSDYYRDRVRHGGILSNAFIKFWWERQVVSNQYGLPGRAARKWGQDTLEGDLSDEERLKNRQDQTIDTLANKYRDEEYYASKEFKLSDIEVPLLSVANWGGILLHLRGNVMGYLEAGSKNKWIKFITGRHDLPFYLPDGVKLQESFLDAFLKDDDKDGWKSGKQAPVSLTLRQGDKGFNDWKRELDFPSRDEQEWPIARTEYQKWHLHKDLSLTREASSEAGQVSYSAPDLSKKVDIQSKEADVQVIDGQVSFTTPAFTETTEFTGHPTARLSVSCSSKDGKTPSDIDLFVTLRYISPEGKEVYYTGTAGDNVPLTKGWLRCSLRKLDPETPYEPQVPHMPRRRYFASDVEEVKAEEIYTVDVEIWPTNVVVEKGGKLIFEVASGDTQGAGIFMHNDKKDRSEDIFGGENHINFKPDLENWVILPYVPTK